MPSRNRKPLCGNSIDRGTLCRSQSHPPVPVGIQHVSKPGNSFNYGLAFKELDVTASQVVRVLNGLPDKFDLDFSIPGVPPHESDAPHASTYSSKPSDMIHVSRRGLTATVPCAILRGDIAIVLASENPSARRRLANENLSAFYAGDMEEFRSGAIILERVPVSKVEISTLVHECVHALNDLNRLRISDIADEMSAWITQALYLNAVEPNFSTSLRIKNASTILQHAGRCGLGLRAIRRLGKNKSSEWNENARMAVRKALMKLASLLDSEYSGIESSQGDDLHEIFEKSG